MSDEMEPDEWDLRGLSAWAMSRFHVSLSQNQLRKMTPQEVEQQLTEAAFARIDETDLSESAQYLTPNYAAEALAEWARSRFDVDVTVEELSEHAEQAERVVMDKLEAAYRRREIEYPVEHMLDMTVGQVGTDNVYAVGALAQWASRKFGETIEAEDLQGRKLVDLHQTFITKAEQARQEDTLRSRIHAAIGPSPSAEKAVEFATSHFETPVAPETFNGDVIGRLVEIGQEYLRREVSDLERFVLLQVYDSSWKEHLLEMDHLRDAIGLQRTPDQDPRVLFKRRGSDLYHEMLTGVRDKVTSMIFRVRVAPDEQMSSVYEISATAHEEMTAYDTVRADAAGMQQAAERQAVETIRRDIPKVGRNDPCPCGSGKKYKKCCGKEG
ncbi:MAG: SEC-C metal-binding domain-containing protein [Planctomycetota bacterium]